MKIISLFDTSVGSDNLGDYIIMDAVRKVIKELFRNDVYIYNFPTHDIIFRYSWKIIANSDFKFVGGTNLLSSQGCIKYKSQWKIGFLDSYYINDVILLGVGWNSYQKNPNIYRKWLYNRILSKNYLHAVRDSYTEKKLKSIGIKNVLNTGCPTMWKLNREHCELIPKVKSTNVLLTYTVYNQNFEYDKKLFNILKHNYKVIYFIPANPKDVEYARKICGDDIKYLNPDLNELDDFLSSNEVDYIGTRLHIGIRALQHKKRTLIIAIDNRAKEISKDTNLPVIDRFDVEGIENWINSYYETNINIPIDAITKWKSQFDKI
jgi:polysaccharide pyruvyl transferase WcaK-like protein